MKTILKKLVTHQTIQPASLALARSKKWSALLLGLSLAASVRAADVTWDGGAGGTSTTWRTVANWNPDGIPTNTDNAILDAAGDATTITVQMSNAGGLQQVGAITLAAGNITPRSLRNNSSTFGVMELSGVGGILLANNSAVQLGLLNQASGFTSAAMGVRLAANGEIYVGTDGGAAQILLSSSISETNGSHGFTKTGPGILYLQGTNNTFTGSVTNLAGSIKLNDTATFGSGAAPVYLSGGNLICGLDRSGGVPISNPIVLTTDAFIINDGGTTNTSRTIPFSGTFSGANTLTVANLTGVADQTFIVRLVGGNTISLPLVVGSGVDTAGSYSVLQLYNSATNGILTINSTISGVGSMRRQGSTSSAGGTAILTGNNSYAGGTAISYGTLLANNPAGSALGSGAVAVTNQGSLGGNGTISATTTINLGGAISPGSAATNVGNLTISDVTLGEGAVYNWNITAATGTAGVNWDLITASSSWTDTASSGNPVTIKLDSLGSTPTGWNAGIARDWVIVQSSSATGFDPSHFAIDTTGFVGTIQGVFSLSVISGALHLTYTPAADIIINVPAGTVTQGQTAPTPYPTLTGTFGVIKVGNGEVIFTNAANDYVGSTKISAGTASLAVDALNGSGALGAASTAVLLGHTTGNSNATLNINTAGVTLGRNVTVQSGSTGTKTIGTTIGSGTATFSGDVTLQDGVVVSTPTGSTALISGQFSGAGKVTKVGAGTLTLTTANTHGGGTVLSNGTLNLNNQIGSGTFTIGGASTIDNTSAASVTLTATSHIWSADFTFAGTTNLSFGGGGVTLNGSRNITVTSNTLTVAGLISGTGGFTKSGAGTLALTVAGASSYPGPTTLSAGLTTIGASTTFGDGSGTLNLAGGTLGLTGTRNLTGGILANPINMTADTVIQNTATAAAGTRNFPLGGAVTASAGTLTIRNIATANINAMHVRFHAGGINFARPVVFDNSTAGSPVNNTSRLGFYSTNGTGDQTFSGVISGPGSIFRGSLTAGTGGATILSGANTFTLGASLDDGALGLGSDPVLSGLVITSSPIGTGTFEWTGNGSLFAHAAPRTVANFVYLNGVRDAKITGTNALTFAGLMDIGTVSKAFTVENTATTTIAGVMTNTAPLIKGGPGVLILSGPNQNSGGWTITNGTLLVNGGAGSSNVVVSGLGVLGGTGAIAGAVTIEVGGTLAPGASIGTLTINSNLTLAGNGLFEVNKSVSPSNDLVVVTGTLTNAGTGSITINNLGPALIVGDSFKLFSQPVLNGSALSITGGGVTWTNKLEVDGSIQVLSAGGSVPPNFPPGGIATLPTGNISLTATGAIGATYKLWATTNVTLTPIATTWTLLSSGTITVSPFTIQDLGATNYSQRFYRFSTP